MPHREHDEELESGSINLLPDEMRAAEYKDRTSSRSNEAPYQLRAPKKERKRRRAFAWLPFFGGTHWVSPKDTQAKGHAAPTEAEAGRIITTGSRPEEPWKPVSAAGSSPIVPISDEKGGSVSPKMSKKFRKGFGFPGLSSWFGGRKKTAIRMPSVPQFGAKPEHTMEMPSRHYSLLTEEQKKPFPEEQRKIEQAPTAIPSVTSDMPMISTTGAISTGLMTSMPERPATSMLKEKKYRRGIRWPRWLDIFYLIELITTPGPGRTPKPKTVKSSGKIEPPRMPSIPTATPSTQEKKKEGDMIRPVASGTIFSQQGGQPSSIRPIMPTPEPLKKKRAFSFSFLRWLNFFSWFHFQPKPKKITMPVPPRPSEKSAAATPETISITTVPHPVQTPVPLVPVPEARPVVQMDAARPSPAPVSPSLPTPPVAGPIKPITPEPGSQRHGGEPVKQDKTRVGLHVPGRLDLGELAMQFKDVNLIPGEYTLRSWSSIIRSLVVAIVAVVALTAVGYVLLNMEESRIKNRSAQIDTEIQKFKNDILFYQKQEPVMTSIGTRIELVKKMLGTHIYWTNFFAMLEKYTLPDVHYDGISATPSGKLSLSAHGSNFETVTKTLQLLSSSVASEFVSTVSVTGAHQVVAAKGGTRVDFVIELTLNPDLFYYNDGQKE